MQPGRNTPSRTKDKGLMPGKTSSFYCTNYTTVYSNDDFLFFIVLDFPIRPFVTFGFFFCSEMKPNTKHKNIWS